MNISHRSNSRRESPRVTPAGALGAVVLVLALGACATTPPPVAQMAVANAAVAQAAQSGGTEFAPTEMAMARDKMARANNAMANKDNDSALALAQQAQVDAQLAVAKANAAKARKSQEAIAEAGRALREELARPPQ